MFLRKISAAIAALAMLTAAVQAQNVLPLLSEEEAAEFTSVGKLGRAGFRSKQSCSGTLIAPDLVLTAGHCLTGGANTDRVFVAGWMRGTYVGYARAAEERIHPRLDLERGPNFDLGLIILEEPITQTAPLPLASHASPAQVALMGYNQQVPHMLTGAFNCPVRQKIRNVLRVGCAVLPGNSGGPIFAEQDGIWAVAGVVSARIKDDALVVPVDDWVRREVRAHLAQK